MKKQVNYDPIHITVRPLKLMINNNIIIYKSETNSSKTCLQNIQTIIYCRSDPYNNRTQPVELWSYIK